MVTEVSAGVTISADVDPLAPQISTLEGSLANDVTARNRAARKRYVSLSRPATERLAEFAAWPCGSSHASSRSAWMALFTVFFVFRIRTSFLTTPAVTDSSHCSAPPVTHGLLLSRTRMPIELTPQVFIRANGITCERRGGEELVPAVGARCHRGNFANGSDDDEAALGHGRNTLARLRGCAYGPVGLRHENAHTRYNLRRYEIARSECVSSRAIGFAIGIRS